MAGELFFATEWSSKQVEELEPIDFAKVFASNGVY